MLAEFALEPRLLSTWDRFQRLIGLFGVTQGRLISRYPKKWQQLVLDSATCGPVEKAKLEEALRRRLDDRLIPRHHQWQDGAAWLDNAVAEHGKRPFHAILASGNPGGQDFVLDASDLDATALPERMRVGSSKVVVRSAVEMAAALRLLLRWSRKVILVDRNFAPDASRFRNPLAEFLNRCLDSFGKPRPVEVELHLGDRILPAALDFKATCASWLEGVIPMGLQFTVVRWKHDDLHNRYVLTDRGGIQFGEGLDEATSSSARAEDVLTLLSPEMAEELLAQYCGPEGRGKQLLRHPIPGKRKTPP